MNDRSFNQLLDAWMDLGPTAAPDRVADAARLEARNTRQTAIAPWWPPRRFLFMNTYAKIGVAAAAAILAALLGYAYLVAPNVGGLRLVPESTPSPDPTAAAAALITGSGALAPGTYEITQIPPLRITFTVPAGWESLAVPAMVWSRGDDKAGVSFYTVNDLYSDPCDTTQPLAGIGPTVEDLVAGLAATPGISIDAQADVSIAGYAGMRLDLSGSGIECSDGSEAVLASSEPGPVDRPHPGDGDGGDSYILDVEGVRLVIHTDVPAADPGGLLATQVESILDSVTIEVP